MVQVNITVTLFKEKGKAKSVKRNVIRKWIENAQQAKI